MQSIELSFPASSTIEDSDDEDLPQEQFIPNPATTPPKKKGCTQGPSLRSTTLKQRLAFGIVVLIVIFGATFLIASASSGDIGHISQQKASVRVTPEPSMAPSVQHSFSPSENPSFTPSLTPSWTPSSLPTLVPSQNPSLSPSSLPTLAPTTAESRITTFYAIGDVPYDQKQAKQLKVQMKNIPADAEFVIHVGDIRKADNTTRTCLRQDYSDVAETLRLSHAPVFVILGDNEWNDCENREEGMQMWREEFLGFDSRYWNHSFQLRRQPGRSENFSFIHKNTLFIALNLVGGLVHSKSEWSKRLSEQVQWTKELIREYDEAKTDVGRVVIFGHADPRAEHRMFFVPLSEFVKKELENKIPMLYLNGDNHKWHYQPSFFGQPSFLRMTLTGGTKEPPLKVSVHATGKDVDTSEAFVYDRML